MSPLASPSQDTTPTSTPPAAAPVLTAVNLTEITLDDRAWPRASLDHERVELFAELLRDARDTAQHSGAWTDPLPPLVVVADGNGGYVLADGRHRYEARRRLGEGFDRVPIQVHASNASGPVEHAFALGLMYSTLSAKPLTNLEKKTACKRLIAMHPEMSDRQVARLVGVSHRTVAAHRPGRLPVEGAVPSAPPETPDRSQRRPTQWEDAAGQLVDITGLAASCQKRFGRGTDFDAAGRRLHDALTDLCGKDADAILDDLSTLIEAALDNTIKETTVT